MEPISLFFKSDRRPENDTEEMRMTACALSAPTYISLNRNSLWKVDMLTECWAAASTDRSGNVIIWVIYLEVAIFVCILKLSL